MDRGDGDGCFGVKGILMNVSNVLKKVKMVDCEPPKAFHHNSGLLDALLRKPFSTNG
jgi:hypothetical protein